MDESEEGSYTMDHDEDDDGFVAIANELLAKFHLSPIQELSQCTASVLVALYEGILGSRLKGTIANPITREDEIHNMQLVIDSLQHDVLRMDLTHITGEAIVTGHLISIRYLIEILAGLLEYVMEQIDSEGSTDVEVDTTDDPDLMTSGTISSISRVLQDDFSSQSSLSRPGNYRRAPATATRPDDDDVDSSSTSTHDLIRLGESAASAYGPNSSINVIQSVADSTADLIREGESLAKKYGVDDPTGDKDPVRDVPTTTEIAVSSAQNASISTASSASWPKEPQVPTTKAPSEFDSIGLGLRPRPCTDKEFTLDSLVPGIGKDRSRSKPHQHVHTHHHYHQPVPLPDPIYASSLPLPKPSSYSSSSSSSTDIRKRHPTDPLPDRAATTRPASSSTSHDNVRSRPYTSGAIHDHVSLADKGGIGGTRDPIRQYGLSYRHTSSKKVPSVRDDLQPSLQSSSAADRAINANNSAKDGVDKELDQSHISTDRISRYQADKLSTSDDLRHLISSSREDRLPGFIPSASDQPYSLASERYKTYLSSRLKESDRRAQTDQQINIPTRLAADKQSRTFPAYETIDTFMPSRPGDPSTSKQPSDDILRDLSSQDSSKTRQCNLTLESKRSDGSGRYSRFDDDRDDDGVARRSGRRITFEDNDEDRGPVSGGYASRTRATAEDIPLESDSDVDDTGTHSDTEVDYSPMPDRRVVVRRDDHHEYNLRSRLKRPRSKKHVSKKRSVLLPPTPRPNLKVRFEDALDVEAKGEMGKIRKKLHKEKKTQERQKQVLQTVYASNLKEVKQSLKQQTTKRKHRMEQEDKQYRQLYGKPKTSKYQPTKKYTAKVMAPENLPRQSRPVTRVTSGKRKRSASSSPTVRRHKGPLHIGEDEMLPTVMQEFPFLHVSPHMAHNMWSKQMRQMEQLTKSGLDLPNKNKTQIKLEEAERRQDILLNIMKKEMSHNQRMRDIKDRQATEREMTSKAREQKQVTARARRYYDEFRLRAQSRMMKRRNREEQIFKKLFEDGLAIQKSRIREMRAYAREKREQISSRQQDEIDSLENYYHDQFSMLAETIAKERHQLQVRDNAQNKVMEQMKREMRRKMEREIRDFQEQLYRDEDTEYFRQIEADRMRKELQMANYKTLL